jgi:nicotinate phosphoribosyltransferase
MTFDSELESFERYADAMPNNCVLLVDTYDTLQGVRHAAQIGQRLKARGHKLIGIRLDSGDLAYLSIEAREILDSAGLPDAAILASNDLDEHLITSLKLQGAKITTWGVGTKLATAYDQPALGGVYKLGATREPSSIPQSAIRNPQSEWTPKIKLSEQLAKISTPGRLQVRRFSVEGSPVADCIYDLSTGIDPHPTTTEPTATHEGLVIPIMRNGQLTYTAPSPAEARARTLAQLQTFHPTILRLTNPHRYPVGLEPRLAHLRTTLVLAARSPGRATASP